MQTPAASFHCGLVLPVLELRIDEIIVCVLLDLTSLLKHYVLRFIRVCVLAVHPYLSLSNIPLHDHSTLFLICSSVDERLCCFQFWLIIPNTPTNAHLQVVCVCVRVCL